MKEHKLTDDEVRVVITHVHTIERLLKDHTKAVCEQRGPEVAVNMLLSVGITTLIGALASIEHESARFAATISTFTAIVHGIKLELAEDAAESIIKKAMQK